MKKNSLPKTYIKELLRKALPQDIPFSVESTRHGEFGDFSSTAAFSLAPVLKKSPIEVAHEIISRIPPDPYIQRIEVAGKGFINFFVSPKLFTDLFSKFAHSGFRKEIKHKREKIIIEFSSPNVAKPLSVGHLRNTILGEFLSRLYEFAGYKVIRWNHLGDWGTQFGKLIVAYKKWGDKKKIDASPITELLALYVRFTKEARENKNLENRARDEFNKLEKGDSVNRALLSWFLKETTKELSLFYRKIGTHFDVIKGESFYIPFKEKFFKLLIDKGLMQKSDGADIIPLENGMPPILLRKSDGATLYHARDLLSLEYRIKKYHPDAILYVVGNDQLLYLSQLFAGAEKIGLTGPKLVHVSYGLVFGPGKKKFSTREGNIITANEVIRDTRMKAAALMHEKHPDGVNKPSAKTTEEIALGAVKYNLLKEGRLSDVVFDFDKMLSFTGNSSLYLQYTYARIAKIISKAKLSVFWKQKTTETWDEADIAVIKKILEYPDSLRLCLETYSAHHLTDYLFSLANELNAFYEKNPVLSDTDPARRNRRLYMLKSSISVLKEGLNLLAIQTPRQI